MVLKDLFEIKSVNNKVLHFDVKGYWSDENTDIFADKILMEWKKAVTSFNGEKFISVPNLTKFVVASDKGKALIEKLMKFAQENNLHHSIQIMSSALTRIGITEASKKTGHTQFRTVVHSVEEANQIIAAKLKEIQ